MRTLARWGSASPNGFGRMTDRWMETQRTRWRFRRLLTSAAEWCAPPGEKGERWAAVKGLRYHRHPLRRPSFPFDLRARDTIPPVTAGTGGISYVRRHIFTQQWRPTDLRPASADCTRRHWEALPASSRTPLGVQGLVEWGEHGGMRTPIGVRGKGVERFRWRVFVVSRRGFRSFTAFAAEWCAPSHETRGEKMGGGGNWRCRKLYGRRPSSPPFPQYAAHHSAL